jgi:2-keto-4-pentenoate hydratase/2-oxohepta-3-ene-1,7-dioic acid hydratase in catechol pathway
MEHIYRVSQGRDTFYAVERDRVLRRARLEGRDIFDGYSAGEVVEGGLAAVRVRTPVRPTKIVCIGQNYRAHIEEMKKAIPSEPVLFFKPLSAILDPGQPIRLPPGVTNVQHEAELAVVVGRQAHRVPRAAAWDYVFGITCLNDVTARDIQSRETQYTRAKGFDTFAPFGPCIAVGVGDGPRTVEGWVNGECRQKSSTAELIFPVDHLIEYITFVMTLEPGDIISTGTPSGVGPLREGDTVTVKVEGVGELTNPVRGED